MVSFASKLYKTERTEWPRQNFSLQYQYNFKHSSDESREKYQLGDYKLIQYQFLQTNITRTVWQTVRSITNKILGVGDRSLIFKPFRITRFKKRKKTFDIWRGSGKNPLPKRRLGLAWFNGSHGDVVNSMGFVRSKSGCLNPKSNRSKYGCLISVIRLIVFLSPLKQIDLSIKRVFLFRD